MNLCIVKHVRTPKLEQEIHYEAQQHVKTHSFLLWGPGPQGTRRVDTASIIRFLVITLLHEKGPTSPRKRGSQTAKLRPPPTTRGSSDDHVLYSASRYQVSLGSRLSARVIPTRGQAAIGAADVSRLQHIWTVGAGGERGSAGELGLQQSAVPAGSCAFMLSPPTTDGARLH